MNIEDLQKELLELKEQINTLIEENTNLKNDNTSKDERIASLQEHNQRLFLKATSSIKHEEKEEDFNSKLIGDYTNLLNEDEIELLKELEEDL